MTIRPSQRTPLRVAVRHAILCLGLGLSPIAVTQASEQTSASVARHFDIPAGPLDGSLTRLSRETGLNVAFEHSDLAGKRNPAVQGDFTAEEALLRLLIGTGLQALPLHNGGYRLSPAVDASGALQLGATSISGSSLGQATEGTGSYTTGSMSTATRLNLSPRETPQTVTVVTRQQMDDFGLTSMVDVLESTSGVYVQKSGGNGNTAYSRGFAMQTQFDGVPNPWGIGESNRGPSPDSAFLDRVEILQGASGLLSGAGEPGGTVNMVRKLPTTEAQGSVEVGGGSWDRMRLVGDVSGPLVDSAVLRGRAVAVWQDGNSFIDHGEDQRQAFYGVLAADLGEATTLTGSVQYQKNRTVEALGIPTAADGSDLGLSRSSFFGADWGRIKRESLLYSLRLDHQLAAGWALRAAYDHSETDTDDRGSYLYGKLNRVTGDGLSLNWNLLERHFASDSLDVHATGPFEFAGRDHELVLGASGIEQKDRNRAVYGGEPINLYDYRPSSIAKPGDPMPAWPGFNETSQHGLYSAVRLSLTDPLKLILGTRVSDFSYETAEGATEQQESGVVSPYAGLVYELNDWSSAYASYSDIFKPQSQRQTSGSTVDPVVGSNYELGIKGEFYDGRLNAAAAIFRLEQENLAKRDDSVPYNANNACAGWCYTASGLVISQGLDLSLNGEVLPGWQLAAGYTYVKSRYGKGEQTGDPYMTELPDHVLRASSSYRLPESNWTIGGDVRAQSDIHIDGNGYRVSQGGLAIVGLMANYRLSEHSDVGFTLRNLFDRKYFQSVGGPWWGTLYGEPRNFMVTWRQSI